MYPHPLPKDSSPFEIDALNIDLVLIGFCLILAVLKLYLSSSYQEIDFFLDVFGELTFGRGEG